MAKISLSKLTTIKNIEPKTITIGDEMITVSQYLPIVDKIALVEAVLSHTIDPKTGWSSPIRTEVHFYLELIRSYTNISITDKMIENAAKTYDLLELNHIIDAVIEAIPDEEFNSIFEYVENTISHLEQYNSSLAGMMRMMSADYTSTSLDIENMIQDLGQLEDATVLKDVLEKLN